MDKASKGGNVKREELRALAETMEHAVQAGRSGAQSRSGWLSRSMVSQRSKVGLKLS